MIVTITPENFQAQVLEGSDQKTIILFFHADQIQESIPMGQLLEKTIGDNNTHITLAKVNAADPVLQNLAMQLGLQSLPALVSFKDKRPVDIRVGAQTQEQITQFIEQYQPSPSTLAIESAQASLDAGEPDKAYATLQTATKNDPDDIQLRLHLAHACLKLKKAKEAEPLLEKIPMAHQDAFYHQLTAELELIQEAAQAPELTALEEQIQQNPEDDTLKQELAVLYSQNGRKEEALDLLLQVLRRDMQFGEAKKFYLDILVTMGEDPSAVPYKRAFYSLLY